MQIVEGLAAFAAGHVHDEDEEFAPDDVAEEIVPEPDVGVGALDEPGDICHGDALEAGQLDDADVRGEGGEGVGGDLRMGGGDFAEEGGFAGVRVAHEAGVGDLAELEVKVALLAGHAFGVLGGGLVAGTFEVDVADAAFAAGAEDELLPDFGEVGDHLELVGIDGGLFVAGGLGDAVGGFGEIDIRGAVAMLDLGVGLLGGVLVGQPIDDGPGGHGHDAIGRAFTKALPPAAAVAVFGLHDGLVEKRGEIVRVGVGPQDDRAAAAAIAAVRPALGHKGFAAKGNRAIAAVTGLRKDSDVIDKHSGFFLKGAEVRRDRRKRNPRRGGGVAGGVS